MELTTDIFFKAIKEFGYPVAISFYLIWSSNKQNTFLSKNIAELQDTMSDLCAQISYVLSATISYRAGDVQSGDLVSNQAIYVGRRRRDRAREDGDNR